tara:strand:+ start:1590 stop:2681 length:1092 start_codon:yes stop_codon:yes gene_type:complete
MNNTIVIDYRWSNKTGIGRHVDYALPKILTSFKKVYLISNNDTINIEANFEELKKIEIIKVKSKLYSLLEQIEIPKLFPKNYDVCWFPNYNAPILIRKNKIIHIHDLAHIDFKRNIFKMIFSYMLIVLNIITSKIVLTVSNTSKIKIIRYFSFLKLDKKIKVIYPGVLDRKNKSINNKNYENRKIILSIGTVKKRKNFLTLVEAFNDFVNKNNKGFHSNNDFVLNIIGQKSNLGDIDYKALSYESENIKFLGQVSDLEIKEIFSKTRLFIFPSLYEGFGMPPIEAMKNEIPTICSDIAVLKEVCSDASIYFESTNHKDLSDKIHQLICDDVLQKKLIKKGLEQSKKYTWKNYNNLLINIIREI